MARLSKNGHEKVLNRLVGQALVDPVLRDKLLSQPAQSLAEHGIPSDLLEGLVLEPSKTLEEVARQLLPVFNGHEH
ncbi:MAG: hypothetical protein HYX86_05575 [Chloroflexi bacterium]|nr:hypothetical protein [Chloroflexota bacterium]